MSNCFLKGMAQKWGEPFLRGRRRSWVGKYTNGEHTVKSASTNGEQTAKSEYNKNHIQAICMSMHGYIHGIRATARMLA